MLEKRKHKSAFLVTIEGGMKMSDMKINQRSRLQFKKRSFKHKQSYISRSFTAPAACLRRFSSIAA